MKKRTTKFICLLLVLVLAMSVLTACGNKEGGSNGGNTAKVDKPTEDREGNAIELPDEINKIAVFAPSIMQMIEAFGVTDKVIAIDTNTPMYVEGMDSVMQFNMMEPDVEKIAELEPDVVFTTGMSYQGNDPYAALREMGICVITIPTSSSIEAIKEDITFVGDCLGGDAVAKAKEINDEFQAQIDEVAAIGAAVTEKKKVLFEIYPLYSMGKGTYIDEMLSIIGAENIFGDQEGWVPVSEEDAVAANPDVILSSVNYMDAVSEILARPGWENVNAVANKEVYYIDNGSAELPNQNIIKALKQMAEAVYPDLYEYEDLMEPAA